MAKNIVALSVLPMVLESRATIRASVARQIAKTCLLLVRIK
jgi:hypothetical protein